MAALLYGFAALCLILWVLGFFAFHLGGPFIHLLFVVALAAGYFGSIPTDATPDRRRRPRPR
jgi:hypothetical protein